MNILEIVSEKFTAFIQSETGKGLTNKVVQAALSKLLPQKNGQLDLGGIVSGMDAQGLMNIAQSWLGDGQNEPVTESAVQSVLGKDKVEAFANELGVDSTKALEGLKKIVPDLVDKSSTGGRLDAGGLINLVGGFFK